MKPQNLALDIPAVRKYLTALQARIVGRLSALDGKAFRTDTWERPEGGGGTSFDPALAWVSNPRNGAFDACIYLTDGCAGEPEVRPRCPMLWVITAGGSTGAHLKFGRVIELPGD